MSIPGTLQVAQRIINAENGFVQLIMEKGFTKTEAEKAMLALLKLKAAKLDPVMGRITMKHGAYWEGDVLRNAVKYFDDNPKKFKIKK